MLQDVKHYNDKLYREAKSDDIHLMETKDYLVKTLGDNIISSDSREYDSFLSKTFKDPEYYNEYELYDKLKHLGIIVYVQINIKDLLD